MQKGIYKPITLIFEGGECVGKSSVVKALSERYDCPYNKRVGTRDQLILMQTVTNDLVDIKLRNACPTSSTKIVLFDRWQGISDLIYQPLFSQEPSILNSYLPLISKTLAENNAHIVFLDVDDDTLWARYAERGDNLVDAQDALVVSSAYKKFFLNEGACLSPVHIDTSDKSVSEVVKYIVDFFKLDNKR